ncbi:MAG: hypothetical protein JWN48_5641, partial [Myxococcaceae bacterium]|nr:hypothetical protein [Myxococcaceae bacterium]
MRRLGRLGSGALFSFWMLTAAACGDDEKGKPESSEDAGTIGGGADSGVGVMDGSSVKIPDASLIAADGASFPADGSSVGPLADANTTGGPDASAPGPCPGGCDDGADCTIDRCVANACTHSIDNSVCKGAASCTLQGCKTSTTPCAKDSDCTDTVACTVNEKCDTATALCKSDVLDRDGDGNPPISCGGTDCNDAAGLDNVGEPEACDGVDNNCDGAIDNGATRGANEACVMGEWVCAAGYTRCNGACVDLQTDPTHCGSCNPSTMHPDVTCGSGGVCTAGACSCPSTSMTCGMGSNASCSDPKISQTDCGGCGVNCASTTQQPRSCLDGACTACGNEQQACCSKVTTAVNPIVEDQDGCYGALSCQGTQGTPSAKCACAAGSVQCEG